MCKNMPDGVYIDTIQSIRKVGSLDEVVKSEIFIQLVELGSYSFDYLCYPHYENFWLNAHNGSRVKVSISDGNICRIQLI